MKAKPQPGRTNDPARTMADILKTFRPGRNSFLSQLVLGHRGKLRKLDEPLQDPLFVQQLMALRMAVILCHARRDPDTSAFELNVDASRKMAKLKLSTAWAEQWPQSAHLLREESIAWFKTGWELKVQFN